MIFNSIHLIGGEIIGLIWDNWVKLNFELEGQIDARWKALAL